MNFIIYPIPFDTRAIMFIGTIIVLVIVFYSKCSSSVEKREDGKIVGLTTTLAFMSFMSIGLIWIVTYFIAGKVVISLIASISLILLAFLMVITYILLKGEISSLNMMIYLFFSGFIIFIVDLYMKMEFQNSTIISTEFISFVFTACLLLDLYTKFGIYKYKILMFLVFLIVIFISFLKIEYLKTININLFFSINIILAIVSSVLADKLYIKFCKNIVNRLNTKIHKNKIFYNKAPDYNKMDLFLKRHKFQFYIIFFTSLMIFMVGIVYSIGKDLSIYVDESKVSQKIMIDGNLIYEGTLVGTSEGLLYISTKGKLVIIDANGLEIKN